MRLRVEEGVFLSLRNRFVAKVKLEGEADCHVHDTGSLMQSVRSGTKVYVRRTASIGRSTQCDVIAVRLGEVVGVDSRLPNVLFVEIARRGLGGLRGELAKEKLVRGAGVNYRADFLLLYPGERPAIVEVKGVNYVDERKVALFPNARSERASRQLDDMVFLARQGFKVILAFVIMRGDGMELRPFYSVDRDFSSRLCAYRELIEYKAFKVRIEEACDPSCHLSFFFAGEVPVSPCSL
ncbi:MAG: DNA/RNA nuclease SfsA [Acidilobaceae archaeon]|nr:DNA/RNA nuclease SfsA [Acidilobaceae archaeon]